jgi:hypothetical protein
MGARGRPSAADLNVIRLEPAATSGTPAGSRSPGTDWRRSSRICPRWFERVPELLEAYCRHVSTANVLAGQINAFSRVVADPEGLKRMTSCWPWRCGRAPQ